MANNFIGQKIKKIRPMTDAEYDSECWDKDNFEIAMVVVLENGAKLYPSRDSEGNGAGALFATDETGKPIGFC